MSQHANEKDDEQIRALIDAWGEASAAGDLTTQLNLITPDVAFLTPGRPPMRRDEFADQFRALMEVATLKVRSNIQEITISGDLAVCWNSSKSSSPRSPEAKPANTPATPSLRCAVAPTVNGASGATQTC
jgi:uncharacterized protein (TIGR02246 family)